MDNDLRAALVRIVDQNNAMLRELQAINGALATACNSLKIANDNLFEIHRDVLAAINARP